MADFQTKVNMYPAIGVPGAFASVNPVISTPLGRIASKDVGIGGFCWDDPSNDGCILPSGTGKPLGFVARNIVYTIVNAAADAANIVPAGSNANVMLKGDFYVLVAEAVTKGQKVFASTTDGTVSGGTAGASVGGFVETDWTFVTSADANGIAIISNY